MVEPVRSGFSTTDVHPYHVAGNRDAATAIGMCVPNCYRHYDPHANTLWLLDHDTASWAAVTTTSGPPYQVRQHGGR